MFSVTELCYSDGAFEAINLLIYKFRAIFPNICKSTTFFLISPILRKSVFSRKVERILLKIKNMSYGERKCPVFAAGHY